MRWGKAIMRRIMAFLSIWITYLALATSAPNVYFGNLHSHTSYSDGSGTPAEAFRYARDTAGLDFLAITEHNHSKAEQGIKKNDPRKDGILISANHSLYNGTSQVSLKSASKRYTEDNVFVAIYGQEFSTISSGNHVNVFEIDEVISESAVPNGEFKLLLDWLVTRLDSQQSPAIIQFNHPSSKYRKQSIEYGYDDFNSVSTWMERMGKHARLIEVLNGPGTINKKGLSPEVSQIDYLHYLNLGFKLAPTGDQDNHWKNWGNSTETRTGVIADSLTKPKILEALRNRRTYATEDRNLRLVFYVNGHLCGDVINLLPAVGDELNIQYSIIDDDEPTADYRIEVFSDLPEGNPAEIIESVTTRGDNPAGQLKSIEDVIFTGEHQYLVFKISQLDEDGNDRAWTAPVWFEKSDYSSVVSTTTTAPSFIASKYSDIYHLPICRVAKGIKEKNKVAGTQAAIGRTMHEGCPFD